MSEKADKLRNQALKFRKLSGVLKSPMQHTTQALMHAEICKGLVEICDALADQMEEKE